MAKKLKNIVKKSFELKKKINYWVHISFLVVWNSLYLRLLSVIPLHCRTYRYLHRICSKSSKWCYPRKSLQTYFDALFCFSLRSLLFISLHSQKKKKKTTWKIPQSSPLHSCPCKSSRNIKTKSVNLMILCTEVNTLN